MRRFVYSSPQITKTVGPILEPLPVSEKKYEAKYERLQTVFTLLKSKKTLSLSVARINQIYLKSGRTFVEDLLEIPGTNIYPFLFHYYKHSSSIRTLLLDGLVKLIIEGKIDSAVELIDHMRVGKIIPVQASVILFNIHLNKSSQDTSKRRQELGKLLIWQTVLTGDVLAAASYLIQFAEAEISVDPEVVKIVLRSIAVHHDSNYLYCCHAIHRLLDVYGATVLSSADSLLALEMLQQKPQALFYANWFFQRIPKLEELFQSNPHKFLKLLNGLIQFNIENGLYEVALNMWISTKRFQSKYLVPDQIESLAKLLKDLPNLKSLDSLVEQIPKYATESQVIVDVLLEKYGTSKESISKFETLLKTVRAPLRRLTLTALFKAYVFQENEPVAEKILLNLLKSKDGATATEINAVFAKLLRQGKLQESIDMILSTDIHIAKIAYVTIFKEVVKKRSKTEQEENFLKTMCKRLMLVPRDDEVFELLTVEIVRYYSTHISNRAAKKIFINIDKFTAKSLIAVDKQNIKFNFVKVGIPNRFRELLVLLPLSKLQCLDVITKRALQEEDASTIVWAVDEYRYQNLEIKDVLQHIQKMDENKFLNSIIRDDIM